jgi:tetratricopeptide (TPR) repeat protein
MTLVLDTGVVLTYSRLLVDMQQPVLAQSVLNTIRHQRLQEADEQRARYLEGEIAVLEKEYDRAITLFEALALDHPDFEMSFVALGQIFAGLNALDLARANFSTAIVLITQKLADAAGEGETPNLLAETQQNRPEVELLTRQLEYLREQRDALPTTQD